MKLFFLVVRNSVFLILLLQITGCFRIKPGLMGKPEYFPFTNRILEKSQYFPEPVKFRSAAQTSQAIVITLSEPSDNHSSVICPLKAATLDEEEPIECEFGEVVNNIESESTPLFYKEDCRGYSWCINERKQFTLQIGPTVWNTYISGADTYIIPRKTESDKQYTGYVLLVPFAAASDIILDALDIAVSGVLLLPVLPLYLFGK